MTTMMALRAHHRGGPGELAYEQAPVPSPGPGEVLVEVHAAAVTFDELTWDQTWITADGADRTPVIPSHEVSGVVAALGEVAAGGGAGGQGDTGTGRAEGDPAGAGTPSGSSAGGSSDGDGAASLSVGDDVFGLIDFDRNGAAAEFVTVPASALARRRGMVSHVDSAALPLAGLTALQALVDHGDLQRGERVLILGGTGGVGLFAVQLAGILGAHVAATARDANKALVESLGAERVVDYRDGQIHDKEPGYDLVIDAAAYTPPDDLYSLVRPGGRLVMLSTPPDQQLAAEHGVTTAFFIVEARRAQLDLLARLVTEGRLRSVVAQTYPLSEGRRAYELGNPEHRPGKTVLVVR